MQKGIIGKKVGMTQLFDENGMVVPVTVVEAGPCVVVQKKTVESDGYTAVQVGFGEVKANKLTKPAKGHFEKAGVAPKKTLKEFRFDSIDEINVGDIIKADTFAAGDKVDVCRHNQALERPLFESYSRYRPCSQTRRFKRLYINTFKSLQGQEVAWSLGC